MEPAIAVEHLQKNFRRRNQGDTLLNKMRSYVSPTWTHVPAVSDVSFSVERGERIAFIGPNGAGKSTTIKMLTGILSPDAGKLHVLGMEPWRQRSRLAHHMGIIFGQRSQLWYHLSARKTFELLATFYDLPPQRYRARLQRLKEDFAIEEFWHQPVRQLSLGQRMRCELVASLLHAPQILFLDEPTIGLDVTAKAAVRKLIHKSSKDEGTTVFLTSHDTGDIEKVCDRVMIIDRGQLLMDLPIEHLRNRIRKRQLVLTTVSEQLELDLRGVKVFTVEPYRTTVEVDITVMSVGKVIEKVVAQAGLKDVSVMDPPLEDVIADIYGQSHEKERA